MQPARKRDLKACNKGLTDKLNGLEQSDQTEWETYAGVVLRHETYKPRTLKSPVEECSGVDGSTAIGNGAKVTPVDRE